MKEYILALSVQNDGETAVREFVWAVHGPLSCCPHKRILNNLFAMCLSAVYSSFSPFEYVQCFFYVVISMRKLKFEDL